MEDKKPFKFTDDLNKNIAEDFKLEAKLLTDILEH